MFEEYFSRIGDIRSNRYVLFGDFVGRGEVGVGSQLDGAAAADLFAVILVRDMQFN